MFMMVSSVAVIILFGHSNVHHLPSDRRLEYFNEWSILICQYHFICFTAFVSDANIKFSVGYSLIAVVTFNFFVNVFFMLRPTILGVIWYFKTKIHAYKVKKIRAKNAKTALAKAIKQFQKRKKEDEARQLELEFLR